MPAAFDTSNQRTRHAAEAPSPDAEEIRRIPGWSGLSRSDRFAVWAAREAVAEADVETAGSRIGVYFGGSTAGMLECEQYFRRLIGIEDSRPRLAQLASQQLNGPGDAVARDLGVCGPVQSFSSACSSGALAIGAAVDAIRDGVVDVAIAGGSDALCALTYAGFNSLRSVDAQPSKPFQVQRSGLSLGEGAGVLVLESDRFAVARGALGLAQVSGIGASCDAHHMTAPHPEGDGALQAMAAALADAGLEPKDVDAVNAHGTGTPHNDVAEARAVNRLFGERTSQLPVMAPKASIGHVLGAAGALEAVITVLGIQDQVVFRIPGDEGADPELGVCLVTGNELELAAGHSVWISTNLAFGGANAALVIRDWEGAE